MFLDADNSFLRALLLWYGIAIPALTSAAVLLASWPLWRRTAATWPLALALGFAYTAGHVGIEGWRPFPPREAADRLWYLSLAAVLLSFLDGWRSCPKWLRWTPCAALWLAVVWFLLPPSIRTEGSRLEIGAWLIGLGLMGVLFWMLLAFEARRQPGLLLPLILLIVSLGTVGVFHIGHSLKLTQLVGVFAAALLPILCRAACKPPAIMALAPVVVILPGLWLLSYFYSYDQQPGTSLLLLAAAALAGSLGMLPGIRGRPAWQRCLICVLAALALAMGSVMAAQGTRKEEEELLLSRPDVNRVTINKELR